tara:strand:- start:77 stop:289 length:213 start_codon:yes stop_codon:yes gene_type:complete
MNTLIIIDTKEVYGRELNYPLSDNAKTICEMLNVKTLSDFHIRKLESLGYQVSSLTQQGMKVLKEMAEII